VIPADNRLKILIIGKSGQVSWDLRRSMALLGTVECAGRPEVDLVDAISVRDAIRAAAPDVLINAAAYTAVDQAESEPELAMKINAEAPGIMAEEMKRVGGLMVHYSTDFVYDGSGTSPWRESDAPGPLNVYGASKLAGDNAVISAAAAHLILRTSWVYAARGRNFLRTVLRLAEAGKPLRIVDDQTGSPTWSGDIALATTLIIEKLSRGAAGAPRRLSSAAERSGIYHMSSAGHVTWYGFAAAILEESRCLGLNHGANPQLVPITTPDYPTPARRPMNSRLSNEKLFATFGIALPQWRESLRRVMEELAGAPAVTR